MSKLQNKFAVGDRVAVYDYVREWMGEPGTVIEVDGEDVCVSVGDVKRDIWLHPKQLRRLKPRAAAKQSKPREFWITTHSRIGSGNIYTKVPTGIDNDWDIVHVIEVLPSEVVVTRESLAKAYCNGREYISLDELCKAVGLEEKRK